MGSSAPRTAVVALLAGVLLLAPLRVRAEAPDPRTLTLTAADLPPGYAPDGDASAYDEGADGTARAVAAFRRTGESGPLTFRSTVTVTGDVDRARAVFSEVPALLSAQGFSPVEAPTVGEESAGFASPDTVDGRTMMYWTLVSRQDRVVAMTTVVGEPGAVSMSAATGLAAVVTNRVTVVLGPSSPATAVANTPAATMVAAAPAPTERTTPPATTPSPAHPTAVGELTLDAAPDIGGGLRLGGLSGLVALDRAGTSFLAVTDRGPNRDVKVHGDKAVAFLAPRYSPSIVKLAADGDRLGVVERIPLRLAKGTDRVTGGAEVSGLPNTDRDESPYDADGRKELDLDPNGVDTEGIALDPRDGTYWIGEEYGPSILHVGSDGTILLRLVPEGLNLKGAGYPIKAVLPVELLKRKPNRGFEGLAMSPDGRTVFAMMQSPLSNPDERAGEASRYIRLVAVEVAAEPKTAGMYVYETERYDAVGAAEQDDIKIGDLAAIGATRLLVTERDSGPGGAHRKVYLIDLSAATDLRGRSLRKPLETMSETDVSKASIALVAKQLLVDLAGLGFRHELVEGLAVVDETTIAVANDNNFDPTEPSELMLVRLPAPLR